MTWSGTFPLFLTITIIQLLSQIFFSYYFLRFREHVILKARYPWLSVLCSVMVVHWAFFWEINAIWPEVPCGFVMYTNVAGLGFCTNTFLLRYWLLILNLFLEGEKKKTIKGWFFRYNWTVSPQNLTIFFLILCFITLIPLFSYLIYDYTVFPQGHCNQSVKNFNDIVGLVIISIFVIASLILIFAIWGKREGFSIKTELSEMAIIGIIGVVIFTIIRSNKVINDFNKNTFSITTILFALASFAIQYLMLVQPVRFVNQEQTQLRKIRKSMHIPDPPFIELLSLTEFVKVFFDFLSGEWCSENLLFLEATSMLDTKIDNLLQMKSRRGSEVRVAIVSSADIRFQNVSSGNLRQIISEVINLFFTEGALLELNVGQKTRQQITSFYVNMQTQSDISDMQLAQDIIEQKLFKQAEREVIKMLEHGPYERFRLTNECIHILESPQVPSSIEILNHQI